MLSAVGMHIIEPIMAAIMLKLRQQLTSIIETQTLMFVRPSVCSKLKPPIVDIPATAKNLTQLLSLSFGRIEAKLASTKSHFQDDGTGLTAEQKQLSFFDNYASTLALWTGAAIPPIPTFHQASPVTGVTFFLVWIWLYARIIYATEDVLTNLFGMIHFPSIFRFFQMFKVCWIGTVQNDYRCTEQE